MSDNNWLTEQFEQSRPHLRAVAYRMLGSLSEAEDAVQEAWLRVNRSDANRVENVNGWLTTIVARLCLDALRARKSRREETIKATESVPASSRQDGIDPESEVLLADSVGLALLVVLETLTPAERIAFVLHDIFDMPFDDIAPIVDRSATAARQLASRARRRVQGTSSLPEADLQRQRGVIDAFLAAARGGDFDTLLTLLDPDVVLRIDPAAVPAGGASEIRGAAGVADRAMKGGARAARAALVNGSVGVVVAPGGRLMMVLSFTIRNEKIVEIEAVADPERLRQLDLALLS